MYDIIGNYHTIVRDVNGGRSSSDSKILHSNMDENDLLDDSKEINMVDTRASSNRVHQHPAKLNLATIILVEVEVWSYQTHGSKGGRAIINNHVTLGEAPIV